MREQREAVREQREAVRGEAVDLSLTWIRTRRLARKTKVRLNPSSSSKDRARQPFSVHSSTAAGMVKENNNIPPTNTHSVLSGGPPLASGAKPALPNPARAADTTHQEVRLPFQSSRSSYKAGETLILSGISLCLHT